MASGGAIIDLDGCLVGIVDSSRLDWKVGEVMQSGGGILRPLPATGESVSARDIRVPLGFGGTPVGVFREFLERRWGR